jgi:hypothetical protein
MIILAEFTSQGHFKYLQEEQELLILGPSGSVETKCTEYFECTQVRRFVLMGGVF